MALFQRGESRVETSPHLRRRLKNNPLKMLSKLALVPVVPLALLWWFGTPALLTTYQYHGSHDAPMMTECNYLALDGWRVVEPNYGYNQCPGLTLLPFDVQAFVKEML